MKKRQILLAMLMTAMFSSCEKQDDYSRLSVNYQYRANLAFAIGSSFLNLPVLGINLPTSWENDPSLLAIPDSIILEDYLPFEPQAWLQQGSEKISQIVVKVRGFNEFPDRAQLTFSLADSLNQSYFPDDSLTTITIPEAIFDNDTVPFKKGNFETYIVLTDNKLKNIARIRHFHIFATIANKTKHDEQYRYYRYLKIEVGVGVQVQFEFNLRTLKK